VPSVRLGRFRIPISKSATFGLAVADLSVSSRRFIRASRSKNLSHLHALERAFSRRLFTRLDVTLDVGGLEHIDPDQTYLVVATHESLLDPIALQHLPLDLKFVARRDLLSEPLVGRYLEATGQPLVNPEQGWRGIRHLINIAPDLAAANEHLVIFPQGSILGIELQFRDGLAWLAERLGWPILPVVLTGGHRIWEHPFSPTVRFGKRLSMRILEPIPYQNLDITALEDAMRAQALSASVAPARRFNPDRDGWWDGFSYEINPQFADLARRVEARRRQA
jgi:1-acyl-sn-glycerol-3-phosphate acyltransferase